MKAIVGTTYRPPDRLEMQDVDKPTLSGDADLLVRVHAASVNALDWHMATGKPYFMRLGTGFSKPKRSVRGVDVSGIVEAVGQGVTRFKPGDEVFGLGSGSFAEWVAADQSELTTKPEGLSFEEAAALPIAGVTALQALAKGGLTAGQRVLVIGAGGGVGVFVVQLAKAAGAEVTGVCSTSKVELVRSLGADVVIDYKTGDFSRQPVKYDLIVDVVGSLSFRELRRVLVAKGTIVLVGGDAKGQVLGPLLKIVRAQLLGLALKQRILVLIAQVTSERLDELAARFGSGKLPVQVDRTVSLPETPEAIDRLYRGQGRAKTVVLVNS